jgi:serine/threonine protein kinase
MFGIKNWHGLMEFDRFPSLDRLGGRHSEWATTVNEDESTLSETEFVRWSPILELLDQALNPLSDGASADLKTIGPFSILRVLGQGGSAIVYLGVDSILGRQVALKVPRDGLFLSDELKNRFLQEAKIIAELRNANIVEIFHVGDVCGRPFLVFEYCSGGSLYEWMELKSAPLSPKVCTDIIRQLVHAAMHAHAHGVAHRDINPRNVLLVPLTKQGVTAASRFWPEHLVG